MAKDSESTESDISIESDPSEYLESTEDANNHDGPLSSEEANHVEWMITEDGELFAVPTENAIEQQTNDSLNNMLSQFYVPSTDKEGSFGGPNLGTIGGHGLELEEADGAFGAMNEYGADDEYDMLMLMGNNVEDENGAIENEIENELEHVSLSVINISLDSSHAILMIPNSSKADSCWEDEMFKGDEPSEDEENGRWDKMLLEQELNHESLMNHLRLDEERSKGKLVDKAGENEKWKGKRAVEMNMESEKAKDQRIVGVNLHPVGIGYGINSKVKPGIQATARKSVGKKLATPAKRPCEICSHTDHPTEECLYPPQTIPYTDDYAKCYYCEGMGHMSMYCLYIAPNAGEGSLRGVGPLMTTTTEEKCLNE
ncbi:unnamed protein product [Arabidopsis thaliana]|uniref:Uncharacterized protein n=2 Tax=Arabidopsis thaliana TaxID=3702 RepID=A0A654FM28_ARATH|nr:nucleic acid binding / zinc ion binding protein [Arabidopsis thaliana]AEE82543.1 nucleic acid binding / zinc ion binding protein [Arabidopsis thaliana]VYS61911.1 unnamed protein product [Arabidopsis thaliana]|eukprot:NP_849306.1 nucleic acid binding / zinc ion binding protein [Arabidopsis thaliana]